MIMNNFREMSFVRSLLVALVVLFVLGAGVPRGALARVEIANGHEGDPQDGMDIVGGGSGSHANDSDLLLDGTFVVKQKMVISALVFDWILLDDGTLIPLFSINSNLEYQKYAYCLPANSCWRAK